MRKIISSIAISLDGYIAKPDGNVDWLKTVPNPDKIDYGFGEFYKSIDTTIMGNNTYKEILGFNIPFPFPDKKNFVLSRAPQANTEFVQFVSDIPSLGKALKEQEGLDIWLIGGGQTNTLFLNNSLIDELIIRVVPVVIGNGLPLFAGCDLDTLFRLVKTEPFSTGVVQLTYQPF